MLLRQGNAGSNTASDHIALTRNALKALPGISPSRPGRRVLIRTDGAGATCRRSRNSPGVEVVAIT